MKKFIILLALSTFASAAMADCRIAFTGLSADSMSKSIVLAKGYQIIDELDLQPGDYIAKTENVQIFWSNTFFRGDRRSKVEYEQVIYTLDSDSTRNKYIAVAANQLTTKLEGTWGIQELLSGKPFAIASDRSKALPTCESLQN